MDIRKDVISLRTIYNEGRVVGYSAYEVYVKQHLAEDPNTPPATEREWLASTLAMGSSMLVQIPVTEADADQHTVVEIQLPNNTRLCAANTILGSFFIGDANIVSTTYFADRVTSYGQLISNTAASSPNGVVGPDGDVPHAQIADWTDEQLDQLKDYMKILDGIIIQPGTWVDSPNKPPEKNFIPDMSSYPKLRLHVRGGISHPFLILLTGFTMRTVVTGETKLDTGSTNTDAPFDGDFLGPGAYPWANKIIFSVPSAAISYLNTGAYRRRIPSTGSSLVVNDDPIIDMESSNPATYYSNNYSNSRISMLVDTVVSPTANGKSVLTIYQNSSAVAPALYGTKVTNSGSTYINPIDTVAPGTIKLFQGSTAATQVSTLETTIPNNYGLARDTSNYIITQRRSDGVFVPIAQTTNAELSYNNLVSSDAKAIGNVVQTGNLQRMSLSMQNADGAQYTITDNPTNTLATTNDNIYWLALLESLANNKKIDIMGDTLKRFKSILTTTVQDNGSRDKTFNLYVDSSGQLQLTPFTLEDNNFGVYHFVGLAANGMDDPDDRAQINYFQKMELSILKFTDDNGLHTFGTYTQIEHGDDVISTTQNWGQVFYVQKEESGQFPQDYLDLFDELDFNSDTIVGESQHWGAMKIEIVPRPSYYSSGDGYLAGAPSSVDMVLITAYIQRSTGKVVCFNRNNGSVRLPSTGTYQCSVYGVNENFVDWDHWTDGFNW